MGLCEIPKQRLRNWRIFHEELRDEEERVGRNYLDELADTQEDTLDPEEMRGWKNNDRNKHEDEPQH
jgi:hypothetical protein